MLQKTHFPVTFETHRLLQSEIYLKANNNSIDLQLSTIKEDGNKENEVQTQDSNSKMRCQISLHSLTIKTFSCWKIKVTVKLQTESLIKTITSRVN